LPPELCAIIHKMMAKQPEARYQTARELGRELARLGEKLRNAPTAILPAPNGVMAEAPDAPEVPEVPDAPMPSAPRLPGPPVGKRWRLALGIGVVLAALLLGLGFGWYRHHAAPPLVGPGAEDTAETVRASFSARERERILQQQVDGNLDKNVKTALPAAVELGLLYLNERRLEKADAFFKGLCPKSEEGCNGLLLSQLGQAMVLAFEGKADASNKAFLKAVAEIDRLENLHAAKNESNAAKQQLEAYQLMWKNSPPAAALRETIAEALYHNYTNGNKTLPKELEPYRQPPRPAAKSGS
jgi:serine/threonine-protein kinase